MIFSVWLYLVLLPPYHAQQSFSKYWQLVLEDMLKDVLEFSFLSLLFFFYIPINIEFQHVTSTYYHSWYLVFEFTFNVTYFHRVIDI